MTILARRAGRPSYRALIAGAVPILWTVLAYLSGTGAAARAVNGSETIRLASGSRPPIAPPDIRVVTLDSSQTVREPVLSRNPFAFAPRIVATAAEASPPPMAPPAAVLPDLPPAPALSLIGIATSARADGRAERTAIITGPANGLHMVREADAVTPAYRVEAVLSDSVVLRDRATGASLRLTLR